MEQYGLGLKLIVNDKKNDGIISAIDFYVDMDFFKTGIHHDDDRYLLIFFDNFSMHISIVFIIYLYIYSL